MQPSGEAIGWVHCIAAVGALRGGGRSGLSPLYLYPILIPSGALTLELYNSSLVLERMTERRSYIPYIYSMITPYTYTLHSVLILSPRNG